MANLATLKAALNAAIYQNTQNAITGESLNTILNSIIDTLGTGYRYAGVATPSANPGTIDNRVFYLATAAGTYTNFGAVQLDGKSLHVFIYDTTWHNVALDVPTTAAIPVIAGSGANSVQGKGGGLSAEASGSSCFGVSTNDGEILATGDGSQAKGYAETEEGAGVDAQILAEEQGAHASGFVYADTESSSVQAIAAGSHAEGSATNGVITAEGIGSHAEGSTNNGIIRADGEGAHAEGYTDGNNISASGNGSHAEGSGTNANGNFSHAEGYETITQNMAEHAEGEYNASHKKTTGTAEQQAAGTTLSSVGCGTGPNDRKNAVEVMQNGDMYVKGVGGYNGNNPAENNCFPLAAILNNLVCMAPQQSSGGQIDYKQQAIIVDTSLSYTFIPLLDDTAKTGVFSEYFQNAIESELQTTANIDNVMYFGTSPLSSFDGGSLESGAACCVYIHNHSLYYFAHEV